MSTRFWNNNCQGWFKNTDSAYCQQWTTFFILQETENKALGHSTFHLKEYSLTDFSYNVTNELHPQEIYENMLKQKKYESLELYDNKFDLKSIRK